MPWIMVSVISNFTPNLFVGELFAHVPIINQYRKIMKVTTSFRTRFSNDGTVYRKMISLELTQNDFERLNARIETGRVIFKDDSMRIFKDLIVGDNYTTLSTADCVCDFLHENIDHFFGNEFTGISLEDWDKARNYNHCVNTMVRIKLVA